MIRRIQTEEASAEYQVDCGVLFAVMTNFGSILYYSTKFLLSQSRFPSVVREIAEFFGILKEQLRHVVRKQH